MRNVCFKKGLVVGIIILIILSALAPITFGSNVRTSIIRNDGNTLYVGGSGPNNYSSIQDAIDDAEYGDTIFVYDDSSPYKGDIRIEKSGLTLIGENKETTIIDGEGRDWYILKIGKFAHPVVDTRVSGFTVQNTGSGNPQVAAPEGFLVYPARNFTISNNIIKNCKKGIHITGEDISDNSIVISDNIFYSDKNRPWGIMNWIHNCSIINNTFTDLNDGIDNFGSHVTISENTFNNNRYGIVCNTFYSIENIVTRNNFINNEVHIGSIGFLNKYKENYWDDYTGKDIDGDGIGDTPYIIWVGSKDNYPLMEPYTGFNPNAPNAPDIDGPPSGKTGEEYDYMFVSTDPNDDDVYYYITWGDGTYEEWIGPYASGEIVTINHTWNKKDTYPLIARAKDIHGLIGPWGTLEVTMPRYRAITNSLLLRFLEYLPILERLLSLVRVM